MLKKVPVSQIRLGMHVHSLDGPWIDHPFWRTRFTLNDARDIERLRTSKITHIVIDTSRGLDVATAIDDASAARVAAAAAMQSASSAVAGHAVSASSSAMAGPVRAAAGSGGSSSDTAPTEFTAEVREATQIVARGREAVAGMFRDARLGNAVDVERVGPLVQDIANSVVRNSGAIVALARLKRVDDYSYMHSVAVCALMVNLGREIGIQGDALLELGVAGLLHDIGKVAIPLEILNKPGRLTDEEFVLIKSHPERGLELLHDTPALAVAREVCLHHHEKIDGTGYPHRLSGDALTLHARMGAICDVYDAVTSNRPYKAPWNPAEAIGEMARWKGHFDPELFAAFVKSVGIYPIGSIVRLESNRIAVVVEQNAYSMTKPKVKVFYSLTQGMPVNTVVVDLARAGTDRIIGSEKLEDWQSRHPDALWAGEQALASIATMVSRKTPA